MLRCCHRYVSVLVCLGVNTSELVLSSVVAWLEPKFGAFSNALLEAQLVLSSVFAWLEPWGFQHNALLEAISGCFGAFTNCWSPFEV